MLRCQVRHDTAALCRSARLVCPCHQHSLLPSREPALPLQRLRSLQAGWRKGNVVWLQECGERCHQDGCEPPQAVSAWQDEGAGKRPHEGRPGGSAATVATGCGSSKPAVWRWRAGTGARRRREADGGSSGAAGTHPRLLGWMMPGGSVAFSCLSAIALKPKNWRGAERMAAGR